MERVVFLFLHTLQIQARALRVLLLFLCHQIVYPCDKERARY